MGEASESSHLAAFPEPGDIAPVRWLAALLLVIWSGEASATILADWDLEEVIRRADSIVIGRVRARRTVVVDRRPLTETSVEVEETLLGAPVKTLVVSQLGGVVRGQASEVVGDARLRVGDRLLLFTFRHQDGRRHLVGMALGAYVLRGETLEQDVEVPLLREDGRLLPPPGPRTRALNEVRNLIRRVGR